MPVCRTQCINMQRHLNYINGAFVPTSDDTYIEVVNPATNAVVAEITRSKPDDVDAGNSDPIYWRL